MKYNGPEWYAALAAFFMCGIIFTIFLNVIQFEIYNRSEVCHPYFYQSSACRKLVAKSIASDQNFAKMKNDFSKKTFRQAASSVNVVENIAKQTDTDNQNFVDEISDVTDIIQNLESDDLGKLKRKMSSSTSPAPSVIDQMKTLLDQTIVDPTIAKYVDPLKRLYKSLRD